MQMTLPFFESLFTLLQPIRKINNGYFLPSFTWSLSLPRECSAAPLQHNFHRPYITLNSNLIYKQHTFRSSGGLKQCHQIVTPCCSQDRLNQNQVMTAIRGVSRPRQDQDFERSRPRPAQDPIGVTRNKTWEPDTPKIDLIHIFTTALTEDKWKLIFIDLFYCHIYNSITVVLVCQYYQLISITDIYQYRHICFAENNRWRLLVVLKFPVKFKVSVHWFHFRQRTSLLSNCKI